MRRIYKHTRPHKIQNQFARGFISLLLIRRIIGTTFVFAFLFGSLFMGVLYVGINYLFRLYS